MSELAGAVHQGVMGSEWGFLHSQVSSNELVRKLIHVLSELYHEKQNRPGVNPGLTTGPPLEESFRAAYRGRQHQLQTRTAMVVQPHDRRSLPSPQWQNWAQI